MFKQPLSLEKIMDMYLFFRISKRKYSSNIIEGGKYNKNKNIIWSPIIAPLVIKKDGDIMCEEIFKVLTE